MDLVRYNYQRVHGYDPVIESKHHGDDVALVLKNFVDME